MNFQILALSTAEIVQTTFPGRATLTPAEVALVLFGIGDKSGAQRVRERLDKGSLLPGLKKSGGRWLIPVASLVASLEALEKPVSVIEEGRNNQGPVFIPMRSGTHLKQGRSRGRIGHRPGILALQSQEVWGKVWEKYDVLSQLREQFALSQHLDSTITKISATSSQSPVKTERF
ncbi:MULTISPECIES: hypothetical protein [Stenotrophomonas maltophilia group]|uniref:hypothetical protein n=1 Tax=Stenotrophomonas maltophilia group TaxID=995085 RepID=UPI001120A980|nr:MULTISPECIES: hypothetical protein [Stenotrophomonas maltophilia group]MBH1417714.1 hypothetical protein [Stenotrophomonas maltophilia]MBH1813616.1 hypothetical protein [Stenotrophomonas maltophilia]MBH1822595.1 hypothetical protein [Stenotrophomonas maltophilia]MBN5155243.1 hypothetical protein [Stenotrophomonas maltophilia]MDH2038311.1 hypothetical protein [Stenotrophomonas maltophilia]